MRILKIFFEIACSAKKLCKIYLCILFLYASGEYYEISRSFFYHVSCHLRRNICIQHTNIEIALLRKLLLSERR